MKTRQIAMPVCCGAIGLLLLAGAPLDAQHTRSAPTILDPAAELEQLFGDGINAEGPAVAPDGSVFFVDAPVARTTPKKAGRIWRWDPETGDATIYRSPSGLALGLEFDAEGRMVVAEMSYFGGRRVTRTDLTTGDREYDAIAPHEVLHHRTPGVYRIDPDGSVHRIIADAGLPNGIVISPDQRTLYIGARRVDMFGTKAILAYDLSPDGDATFRSVLVRYEAASGEGPDGLAVDAEGNVWAAIFSRTGRTGVAVYSPGGAELAFIPTPEPAKNLAFSSGAEQPMLYITAGQSLYRIPVLKSGHGIPRSAAGESREEDP